MFGTVFSKMDQLICSYLGLGKKVVTPSSVQLFAGKLVISSTMPFKRHAINETWDEFNLQGMSQVTHDDLEKLGVAIGKALAKKLTISFEEIKIK